MKKILFILSIFISVCSSAQPTWSWAEDALGTNNEEFLDIATDPVSGISYAVGFFSGDISLEFPLGLNNTPDMSTTIGNQDGLVAKYDAAGNAIWAFKIGNTGDNVWITGVEIGAGGNIFITGHFNDNCNFQGVTGSSSIIEASVNQDAFLAKYDSNGNLIWVRQGNSIGEVVSNDIDVNSSNVYITGWFANSLQFDSGGLLTASNDGMDTYVMCYDQASGNLQWESFAGDIDACCVVNDRGWAIAADDNEVYITGTHTRTIEFDGGPLQVIAQSPGNRNIYLAEYDAILGTVNWVGQISPTAGIGSAEAHGLAVDANFLFVAGGMSGNVSVPGGGPVVVVPGVGEEIFACSIDRATKTTQWVEVADNNNANPVIAEDIVTDGVGNVYVTGPFRATTQFNNGLDVKVSLGQNDCFVMAMKDIGTYLWTNVASDPTDVIGQGIGYDNTGAIYIAGMVFNQANFGVLPILGNASGDDAFVAKINPCGPAITTCENDTTINTGPGCTLVLGDFTTGITAMDLCGTGLTIKQIPIVGTVMPVGTDTVWIFVTDGSGNVDSCSFEIIVTANVNPTLASCGDVFVGETTIGQGDNGGPFACTVTTTPGEDVYYQIDVPTGNYQLSITMSNVVDGNDTDVNTFWVGGSCPIGSGCLSTDNFNIGDQDFDSNGQNQLIFNAIGPGTYYFVVDSETDGIDSYDIAFNCVASGIEFDETNCGLDVDNDGLYATVDGLAALNVIPCQTATFCHTIYTQNILGGEWLDTLVFDLGPCYTNITNLTPDAPGPNGTYDAGGTWYGTYSAGTNSIEWGFDYSGIQPWGDGFGGIGYSCRPYTFCFDADISSTCVSNDSLNIQILIEDDGVNGAIPGFAPGFDYATSDGFTISNPNPTVICPSNVSVSAAAGLCAAQVNGIAPILNDNCSNPFAIYILTGATSGTGNNDASGSSFNVGITTVKYIVSDSLGLLDSCTFTVTVNDTENPTIICPGNFSTNAVGCSQVVIGIAPTASGDNCVVDSIDYVLTGVTTGSGLNDASGIAFNTGVTTVTYNITDTSGNTFNCSFTVTINDLVNPTITCPGSINVNNDIGSCGAIVNSIGPVAFNDNCAIDSVSYTMIGATTASGLNDASGVFFNFGTTNVTYMITDVSGNTQTCGFSVIVADNESPTIVCSVNVSVSNDVGLCSAIVNGIASTPADNCGIDSVSYILSGATILGNGLNDASGLTFNNGITTVTYTVTDLSGNIATCNFTVTVNDNENPTITCLGNVNVSCPGAVSSLLPLNSTDNCGVDSVSYLLTGATLGNGLTDASGEFFNVGITTVIYTITDLTGNTASCNFTVTVLDNINPTIICPGNVNVSCPGVLNSIGPSAFGDNCGVDSVSYVLTGATLGSGLSDASGTNFNQGITTITYTVTDSTGNTASCNFTVTVLDNINPTITCPANVNVGCPGVVNSLAPSAFGDNCGVDSVNYVLTGATLGSGLSDASGINFNQGITTITYTVTDSTGNTASCNFTVTVDDIINPTITCPGNIVTCDPNVTVPIPVFGDNCGAVTIVNDFNLTGDATGVYPLGITSVNFTVTDANGNTTGCTMTIEVETPPVANAGPDQTIIGLNSTNFDASAPSVGIGSWLLILGFGNISNFSGPISFVNALEPGDNIFEWIVSNGTCPNSSDEVIITYIPLDIPNGFSPNGDGNNDIFEIKGIDLIENELIIFNRWGVELYSMINYQNDWDGTSKDGKTLPEDTYFYLVKIPGLEKELSGFIVLKR